MATIRLLLKISSKNPSFFSVQMNYYVCILTFDELPYQPERELHPICAHLGLSGCISRYINQLGKYWRRMFLKRVRP